MVKRHVTHHAEVGQKFPATIFDDAIFFEVLVVELPLVAVEVDGKLVLGVVGVGVSVIEQRIQVLLAILVLNLGYKIKEDLVEDFL